MVLQAYFPLFNACLYATEHSLGYVCSGDITAITVPSLAASRAAARPAVPQLGQVTGDWFLKKGGWRVVSTPVLPHLRLLPPRFVPTPAP